MFRQLPRRLGFAAIFGGNRYLVPWNRGIATTSVRTGLAMTGNLKAKLLNTNLPVCFQKPIAHTGFGIVRRMGGSSASSFSRKEAVL